ncbi:AAA family ATPase [Micromonospora sp. DT4]|uniref:AAA family ATPase n=1 Tax=Micromonospora sp. DT4 TaxID=3393438 RepID=UPI003CE9A2DE
MQHSPLSRTGMHAMTSPGGTIFNRSGTVKLGPKQLREQILGVLAGDPAKVFSLREIRAAIGRSSGAVPLAVKKLVELGQAEYTGGGYRFSAATGTLPAPAPTNPISQAAPTRPGPIQRPSGDLYYPRALAGGSDVDVLRKLRAAGLPVLLYGPPGTGKTSLLEAAFPDLVTLAGDEDTTVGDLVGDYVPDGTGGYRWVDGPLTVAMTTGAVLLVDDATLINPKVLAAMYPVMDGRGQLVLKAHAGRIVRSAPGFYTVAGHNPGVHGAVLTEALASRFTAHIEVTTDYDLAQRLGVDRRLVSAARSLTAKVKTGEIGWSPQMRELLGAKRLAAEIGLDNAIANLIGIAPPEDRDTVIAELKTAMRTPPPAPLAVGKQL